MHDEIGKKLHIKTWTHFMDTTYILAYLDTLNQNRDQIKGHNACDNLFSNVQVEYPMAVPETIEKLVMQFS